MSDSSDLPPACPKCGASLPAGATDGLCPKCLMNEAMQPSQASVASVSSASLHALPVPTPEELAPHFPAYEIQHMLGRGGMGAVYLARQLSLNRPVAIKILPDDAGGADRNFALRFRNEAQAMAQLSHPGIVSVYDFGQTANGLLFIVMEYIEGTDVAQMVANQGRLHSAHAMAITAHVCDALAYAHARGIVHRDIKPSNIMISSEGVVKVADFGLAKVAQDAGSSGLTQSGMVMGTPHFVAPEALTIGMDVDQRADIYAVGVMLYQMLTGKLPQGLFEMPSFQVPGLDPRYDRIVAKALREDRELRYQDAKEMRFDLDAILTQPVEKVEPPQPAKVPAAVPPPERKPSPAPAAASPRTRKHGTSAATKKKPVLALAFVGLALLAMIVRVVTWKSADRQSTGKAPHAVAASSSPVVTTTDASGKAAVPVPPAIGSTISAATKDAPFVNSLGMKFVPVPITGGPTDKQRVLFSVWETRVRDYEAFINETKRPFPKPRFASGADHPAVNVDWHNAVAFCEWLTERGRKAGQLTEKDVYRLPTDHEWSCAIGIGDKENAAATPRDKNERLPGVFPWGGSSAIPPSGAGNYAGTEFNGSPTWLAAAGWKDEFPFTAPVGSCRDDTGGLFDLGGNVWEWCQDWDDPVKGIKVLRGGRWNDPRPESQLSSSRHWLPPSAVSDSAGFRVVLEVHGDVPTKAAPLTSTTTGWIDLLALVDAEKDTISGKWTRVKDGLHGEKLPEGKGAQYVQLPYEVPEEYDFRVTYTTLEGNCEAAQILSAAGRQFIWGTASGQPEKWAGFNMINGKPMMQNGSGVKLPGRREVNRRYESLVEVRRDRVTGYVDGQKLVEWKTDYQDMSPDPPYAMPNTKALGFGIWWSKTVFHEIAVREVTGKGKLLRSAVPPQASSTTNTATKDAPFVNSLGMKFVPVPGTGILMCIHETRKGDYRTYAEAIPGVDGSWKNQQRDGEPISSGEDHPVCAVSWEDAKAFCEWLSKKEGRRYRLPTDREWSFAAGIADREDASLQPAMLTARFPGEYIWGTQWPPPKGAGNFADSAMQSRFPDQSTIAGYTDGHSTTAPVMSFTPNKLGIYDLAGNVWERCEDLFSRLQTLRVIRGGCMGDGGSNPGAFDLTKRNGDEPGNRHYSRGFRCVIEVAQSLSSAPSSSAGTATDAAAKVAVPAPPASASSISTATKDAPFTNTLGMKFVPVPITGGPTNGKRLLFSVWETRVQDYEPFAKATKRRWDKPPFSQGPTHPAVKVSWDDAKTFCELLTVGEHAARRLPAGATYRLPSDHEWSCAADIGGQENSVAVPRAKDKAIHRFPWPGLYWPPPAGSGNYFGIEGKGHEIWSNQVPIPGSGDDFPHTAPVGSFAPNRFGLHDLSGNAWEWCADWFDEKMNRRVLRGASFACHHTDMFLLSHRRGYEPTRNDPDDGFRVVLDVEAPATAVTAPPRSSAFPTEPGYTALFEPPQLSGWKEFGDGGGVEFADGVLTLKPRKPFSGCFWYARQAFSDFNLRLQFKLTQPGANSGVMLRFETPGESHRLRYDVDLSNDRNPLERTGALMFVKAPTAEPQKMGEWNDLEITATGQQYRVWVNGILVNEFTGNRRTNGYIGLQLGRPGVQIRNMRIK